MAVRDFDTTQLTSDWTAILDQAGITFSCGGSTVTGVWGSGQNAFAAFEEQRRDESKYTIFLTSGQLSAVPAVASTLVRAGVTYFVERVELDAEGTGLTLDVAKAMK